MTFRSADRAAETRLWGDWVNSPLFAQRILGPLLAGAALTVLVACGGEGTPTDIDPVEDPPPLNGTAFIDPDIITSSDTSTLVSVVPAGQGSRVMFDRRVDAFITIDAHLFDASFDDGLAAEIQVNPELDSLAAAAAALKYAEVIGRLPTALRSDVETVWIHLGVEPFGGGNNNLLIHVGQADLYEAEGVLEEIFVHEAVHTSLDAAHTASAGWLAAQVSDPTPISGYAQDFPGREDLAESFGPWLAVRFRSDRITSFLRDVIVNAIPARLDYFDSLNLDMYPIG